MLRLLRPDPPFKQVAPTAVSVVSSSGVSRWQQAGGGNASLPRLEWQQQAPLLHTYGDRCSRHHCASMHQHVAMSPWTSQAQMLTWRKAPDMKVLCHPSVPPPNDTLRRGAAEAAAGAPLPVAVRAILPADLRLQCACPNDPCRCFSSLPIGQHDPVVCSRTTAHRRAS